MKFDEIVPRRTWVHAAAVLALLMVAASLPSAWRTGLHAQEAGPRAEQPDKPVDPVRLAEEALAKGGGSETGDRAADKDIVPVVQEIGWTTAWDLYWQGGILMIPITFMSFVVVVFGLERAIGLRRGKVLPPELISALGRLASQKGGLDPRQAYKLCQRYPSAAANVIRSMLLKVGRPHSELEQAVREADEREANKLYRNVRWLNLSATVTPLMGLLGTVQGMIQAFFVTAHLPIGANKAEHLAKGIYVALVTTFGGLCVAIPAAMLAHFFEGRIQRLFGELDETLMGMLPQLERFEGRLRVSKDQFDDGEPASDGSGVPRVRREVPAGEPAATQPTPAPQ